MVVCPIYTYQFFSHKYTLLFWRKLKSCCDCCFLQQIILQNTVQLHILQDYSSVRIDFNTVNKCHTLPEVYTMLVQSLLFYSELNTVYSNYVWILKLVSTIFYQIFISNQMIALQKLLKMLFISSKKLFSFSRYSIFCIFVFPSFSPCQPLL